MGEVLRLCKKLVYLSSVLICTNCWFFYRMVLDVEY